MKHVSRADYGRVMEVWPTSGAKMPVLYITDTKISGIALGLLRLKRQRSRALVKQILSL